MNPIQLRWHLNVVSWGKRFFVFVCQQPKIDIRCLLFFPFNTNTTNCRFPPVRKYYIYDCMIAHQIIFKWQQIYVSRVGIIWWVIVLSDVCHCVEWMMTNFRMSTVRSMRKREKVGKLFSVAWCRHVMMHWNCHGSNLRPNDNVDWRGEENCTRKYSNQHLFPKMEIIN